MGWIRNPKTTQERRRYVADVTEVRLRAARSATLLPTSYDDLFRWVTNQRCWKRQRKTQYKPH